jgi:hypothetical protein
MSHFDPIDPIDPIDPNVLIPLMPTVFLYSAAHLKTDLCRFTPPLHPTRVKFNHWAHTWILNKKIFSGR